MPTAPWIRPALETSLLPTALATLPSRSQTALELDLLSDAFATPLFFSLSFLCHTLPSTYALSRHKPHTSLNRPAYKTAARRTHRRSDKTLGSTLCGPSRNSTSSRERAPVRAGEPATSPKGKRRNRGEDTSRATRRNHPNTTTAHRDFRSFRRYPVHPRRARQPCHLVRRHLDRGAAKRLPLEFHLPSGPFLQRPRASLSLSVLCIFFLTFSWCKHFWFQPCYLFFLVCRSLLSFTVERLSR